MNAPLGKPLYTPSPWGELFHSLPYHEVLGAGAAGPGKSLCLLMDPVQQVQTEHLRAQRPEEPEQWLIDQVGRERALEIWPLAPGASTGCALHLRRTRPMLEETIARSKRIFPLIDPYIAGVQGGAQFNEQKTTWTFSSGFRYQFGHCKDPDDWQQYLSNEYTWIGYDELVQFDEEQYDQINTRLRSSDPVLSLMLKIRACSNPMMKKAAKDDFAVKDPFWVRRRFVAPAPGGKEVLKRWVDLGDGEGFWYKWMYLPATIDDNPDPNFRKQYKARLASAPAHIRQALLYGNWFITEGSFYGEWWNEALHTCVPFEPPDEWAWFRTLDWGFKNHGCVHWWALDYDGTLYCVRELTFIGKMVAEVADEMRELEQQMGLWGKGRSLISGAADTQLWEQRGDGEGVKSKAEQFAEKGIHWLPASKRRRQTNAEHFVTRLQAHDNGTKLPGIVFFKRCKQAIMTIPGIPTSEGNPNEPQDGGPDHWHDSTLYACAFASRGRAGIPSRVALKDDWEEDDEERGFDDRGRDGYGARE